MPRKKPEGGVVKPDDDKVKIAVMNNDIKHINETLTRMESKFDSAINGFVTIDKLADAQLAADKKHTEQDARIEKLEDWNTWAIRIVLGFVITAVVGLALTRGVA